MQEFHPWEMLEKERDLDDRLTHPRRMSYSFTSLLTSMKEKNRQDKQRKEKRKCIIISGLDSALFSFQF